MKFFDRKEWLLHYKESQFTFLCIIVDACFQVLQNHMTQNTDWMKEDSTELFLFSLHEILIYIQWKFIIILSLDPQNNALPN